MEIGPFSGTRNLAEVPRARALQAAMYISMRRLKTTETDSFAALASKSQSQVLAMRMIPLKPPRESASESYCQFDWTERENRLVKHTHLGWCLRGCIRNE